MDPNSPEYAQHQQQMQQQAQTQPPPPPVQVAQIRAKTVQDQEQSQTQREVIKLKGQLVQSQAETSLEHAKADKQMAHEVMQGSHDREISIADQQGQMAMTLMKIIGQIVAAQLKQDPSADAGQILKHDYQEVRGSV